VSDDDFRITDDSEALSLLLRLCHGPTPIHLCAPEGTPYTTVLLVVDVGAGRLGFDAQPAHPSVAALVDAGEATAVAYLDSVRLQFDLTSLVLVHSADGSSLHADLPVAMYRYQRRETFRVRARGGATAQFVHPAQRDRPLQLRVLDVSAGGCALALPAGAPAIEAGAALDEVRVDLDADTRFETSLIVQHVSSGLTLNAATGTRLGCAFGVLDSASRRALQRYVDLTQRRQRALAQG
jgi:c-di-GMP-binding flagellar brake protein YcgR